MRAVGYVRLSKADRRRRGETEADTVAAQKHSLEAQRTAIERAAEYNGWELVGIFEDNGKTGANIKREQFQAALHLVRTKQAEMLVVAKLDRLSRDTVDFGTLLKESERKRNRWYISILDEKIDTSTAAGWLSATMLAVVAEYERRVIGERTRDALAVIKDNGGQLGRQSSIPDDVQRKITRWHKQGASASAIARRLADEGIETARGGTWHHSVIGAFLKRQEVAA